MKKFLTIMLAFTYCAFGYAADHEYPCIMNQNETEVKAFIYQLEKDGSDYHVNDNGELCLPPELSSIEEVMKLKTIVGEYYAGVAYRLTSEDGISKVKSWLSTENVPHKMSDRDYGIFLVIYSESPEKAKSNREKMESILGR